MAPIPKLTYFGLRGRAEHIRLLLKYGQIDFEDVLVPNTDWASIKPETPFGQLPIFEENGKTVGQSVAIARYVAKKVKLVGANDWENLEIDAIVDTISDIHNKLVVVLLEKDSQTKEKLSQTLTADTIPFYFERLNKIANENNGYLSLKKLTWADFYFTTFCDLLDAILGDKILHNYPSLKKVRNNVLEIPTVKAWVESRPKTNI